MVALSLALPLAACAGTATSTGPVQSTASEPSVVGASTAEPTPIQVAQNTSGNPLRPGLWEFTRAGGMAANSLGKHCIRADDLINPRSRVNGYLSPDEKQQCSAWRIDWQGGGAQYDGTCTLRGNQISIKGRITASAEYYSDEQQQARDESGFAQAVKDIINGRRIGDC